MKVRSVHLWYPDEICKIEFDDDDSDGGVDEEVESEEEKKEEDDVGEEEEEAPDLWPDWVQCGQNNGGVWLPDDESDAVNEEDGDGYPTEEVEDSEVAAVTELMRGSVNSSVTHLRLGLESVWPDIRTGPTNSVAAWSKCGVG